MPPVKPGASSSLGSAWSALGEALEKGSTRLGESMQAYVPPPRFRPSLPSQPSLYVQPDTVDSRPVREPAVAANDVRQNMANCYLQASIAAVAERRPETIKSLIREHRDPWAPGGVSYTVSFFEPGKKEKREITVDAVFPADRALRTGDVDARGRQEIWPLIIEKAYGQLKGFDYAGFHNGGDPADALFALTGARPEHKYPTAAFLYPNRLETQPALWDELARSHADGKLLVLATKMKPVDGNFPPGLVGWHALWVKEFVDDGVNKSVKLGNPYDGRPDVTVPWKDLWKYVDHFVVSG